MMTHADLLEFWRSPMPHGNAPEDFIAPIRRSEVLAELIADVPRDARILEVGCNVGRNLAYLTNLGYERLEGLEISIHAIALMRETYPQLDRTPVHVGPAEDILPRFTRPYDLIFTMAVLEHVHPVAMPLVVGAMASLTHDALAVEPVPGTRDVTMWDRYGRQYPHDLDDLFTRQGLMLVSCESLRDRAPDDFSDYAAWRFQRPLGQR